MAVRHAIMQVNYYVRIRTVFEDDAEELTDSSSAPPLDPALRSRHPCRLPAWRARCCCAPSCLNFRQTRQFSIRRSRISVNSIRISVVIRATQIVSALRAHQLAVMAREQMAAIRADLLVCTAAKSPSGVLASCSTWLTRPELSLRKFSAAKSGSRAAGRSGSMPRD